MKIKRLLKKKSLIITAAAVVVIGGAGASYALVKQYTPVQNATPTPSVEVSESPSPSPVPEVEGTPAPTTSVSPTPSPSLTPVLIQKEKVWETFFLKVTGSNAPNSISPFSHIGLINFIYRTYEKNPSAFEQSKIDEIFEICKTQYLGYYNTYLNGSAEASHSASGMAQRDTCNL